MAGLLARKIEMTRVIKDDKFIPVTLLTLPHMQVVGYKTQEKDGYSALIVGISSEEVSPIEGKTTLSKNKLHTIREFPIDMSLEWQKPIGTVLGYDELEGVERVTLSGISKGKGFTGAMKRHNFSGGPKTHGSKFHRALGSIWNRKPTRTHKGKKMHGHMGTERVTLRGVRVELLNKEAGIVGVRWAVPGARNSLIEIYFNN